MGAVYRRKRHSCGLCKPHKIGYAPARTERERMEAREAEVAMRCFDFSDLWQDLAMEAGMDPDGYPDEDELRRIREWPLGEWQALLEFVRDRWRYADMGYWREKVRGDRRVYEVSTGGWSGNEDLIKALLDHEVFWPICWVQSRRGGHYIFEIRDHG